MMFVTWWFSDCRLSCFVSVVSGLCIWYTILVVSGCRLNVYEVGWLVTVGLSTGSCRLFVSDCVFGIRY